MYIKKKESLIDRTNKVATTINRVHKYNQEYFLEWKFKSRKKNYQPNFYKKKWKSNNLILGHKIFIHKKIWENLKFSYLKRYEQI